MKLPLLISALLLVAVSVGCATASDESGAPALSVAAVPADKGAQELAVPKNVLPRKVIYKAQATLLSENFSHTTEALESEVKTMGGYVASAEQKGSVGSSREGTWSLRIPSDRFDQFMKSLPSLGEVQFVSRHSDDVSEEFYDVQARLKNKRVEEDRILQLMQNRSAQLSDVLTLERELSRVREETERIEGRLKFLTNQTDLSSIDLTIQEIKGFQPEGTPGVSTKVGRAFSGSVDVLKALGTGMLMLLVALVPWVLPLSFIAWLYLRHRKPRKQLAE